MKQTYKSGKPIVSKGEYAKRQGKRVGVGMSGLTLWITATLCGLATMFCFFGIIVCGFFLREPWAVLAPILGTTFLFAFLTYITGRVGIYSLRKAAQIETGVPLTRANTEHLSARDSLVRLSQEPLQAQKAILLRPATHSPEERAEQLVRPAGGQEQA